MVDKVKEKQYNKDIIICIFDKIDFSCFDYKYNTENEKYIRNDKGTMSKNYIIPLGIENLILNIVTKNAVGYKKYYCVKFFLLPNILKQIEFLKLSTRKLEKIYYKSPFNKR